MIWDPVKPFACQCPAGYEGQLCEKGNTGCNMPFILLLEDESTIQFKNNIIAQFIEPNSAFVPNNAHFAHCFAAKLRVA